ncbi:hypothetical protein ACZ90_68080 [Streptomyces albus subsp. albus]|nr:hypothetical protein ACZ90_68080 [Streptomyces albus subsp. albus]
MDYLPHFHREVLAFEAAVRRAAEADGAPLVPSCPGWSVADLTAHLGGVHRFVARIVGERADGPPDVTDLSLFRLPADLTDWPLPERAPHRGPLPDRLIDWFADGAAELEAAFRGAPADTAVWSWSAERTVGFWLRVQSIEAAVHRWDAQNAVGTPCPIDAGLAHDAVRRHFEVLVPAWRTGSQAPPGAGERYRFRQTDGSGDWRVRFLGEQVLLTEEDEPGGPPSDVELAGTASDLMLFLWRRVPADRLVRATGNREVLDRYFTLAPLP